LRQETTGEKLIDWELGDAKCFVLLYTDAALDVVLLRGRRVREQQRAPA